MSDVTLESGKTPQELYAERTRRIQDALALRRPDRVPVSLRFGNLLADLEGVTRQAMYEDPDLQLRAMEKAALHFQPDHVGGMWHTPSVSKALGDRSTKWPGYGNGPNVSFQYHEHEFMKAEDYDAFLEDPSDWAIRTYLPRVFENLEGLSLLPPLPISLLGYYGAMQYGNLFAQPELIKAMEAMLEAAKAQAAWLAAQRRASRRLAELGFAGLPIMAGSLLAAPFDFMSDTLRGMRGIFLDLRRNPDKLLAAQQKVIAPMLKAAQCICAARNCPYAFFPLHRGSDGFIALPQFEKFYWPQLVDLLNRLIEAGITPVVFYEGCWDQRLQYLAQLPKGKTVGMFQGTNLFKAKEYLSDVMPILGGMPVSMLISSSPEEIRAHTKKICEEVGKGGGLIMTTDIGELEGCNPKLIKVWIDSVKEYGAV
jgi:uroporphyrinogen-III decarboxylase